MTRILGSKLVLSAIALELTLSPVIAASFNIPGGDLKAALDAYTQTDRRHIALWRRCRSWRQDKRSSRQSIRLVGAFPNSFGNRISRTDT